MTDDEIRGWLSTGPSRGIHINSNALNAICNAALTARARVAELETAQSGIWCAAYFDGLVCQAHVAAEKASRKYPQPNYIALKIAEEAGEVVRGGVHYAEGRMEWSEVEGEIVQLLAMLIRFVTEGDQVNGIIPPALKGGE